MVDVGFHVIWLWIAGDRHRESGPHPDGSPPLQRVNSRNPKKAGRALIALPVLLFRIT